MRAAIYYGPRDIRVEEIDYPKPGDHGMVIKVRAAGICGSDLHPYQEPWVQYTTGIAIGQASSHIPHDTQERDICSIRPT